MVTIIVLVVLGGLIALVMQAIRPSAPAVTPTIVIAQKTTLPPSVILTTQATAIALPTLSPPTIPSPIPTPLITPQHLNLPALQQFMLQLINKDRRSHGLSTVAWDKTAAVAGQAHAEDMARYGYTSHWNLNGHGPDYRYSQAGGLDSVRENVYSYYRRYSDDRPAPITDWDTVIREAESNLMRSPGHRDNILAAGHTHVGAGIAYNPHTGEVRIAQEFVNHYVGLETLPLRAMIGDIITVEGQLLSDLSELLLSVAYEPFPASMTVTDLNETGAYVSPAESFFTSRLLTGEGGRFSQPVTLDHQGQPGLYHVQVYGNIASEQVQAVDVVVEVK